MKDWRGGLWRALIRSVRRRAAGEVGPKAGAGRRRSIGEAQFHELVDEAVDSLPEEFARHLENVQVVVEDAPSPEQLRATGRRPRETLLGLYVGVPLTQRSVFDGYALPDRIFIFREPILAHCRTPDAVRAQVRRTVLHEIAHHFGIPDERLRELGY